MEAINLARTVTRITALAGLALLSAMAAVAQGADAYRGKSIDLIIGSDEGGSYDISGRFIAAHLRKFVPGNPTIIPRNMPGASSVRAAEHLYNVAAHDGTALGYFQPTIVYNKVTDPTAKYEPEKFGWLGRFGSIVTFGIVWSSAPAQSIDEAKTREVVFGANGPTGTAATVPWALNRLIGTRFKVVRGYTSEAAEALAMERGEIQGIGSAARTFLIGKPDWFKEHKVTLIYTIGLQRDQLAPDVPTIVELAGGGIDRDAFYLLATASTIGRALLLPPGTRADRAAILHQAFADMVRDREVIADAQRAGLDLEPLDEGEERAIVARATAMPAAVIERVKALTAPQ
jgi:tripartite-type tricarboxylate transporter receptor subunit TctC